MAEPPARRRVLWQDFELDLRLHRLLRAGQRIPLQPIPLQILAMLVERPGELVSRDELHHQIWNGYSYGDFDHSLNIAISKLRTALGDSAKVPQFIETLPQVGYRFISRLETKAEATGEEAPAAEVAARGTWWRRGAAVTAAVSVLGLAAYWIGTQDLWRGERATSVEIAEAARLEGVGIPPGRVAYVHPNSPSGPFRFTGTGADYVRIPNSPLLEPEHVTVDAWVRAAGSPGKYRYVVSKGANECGGSSYGLYTGTNGGIVFYVSGPPRLLLEFSPPAPESMWDGRWHHVAGTYDGSVVRLYLDGNEVGLGARSSQVKSIVYGLVTHNDLLVGNFVGTCTAPFTGEVGEVQVFNRAISLTEVGTLFRLGAVRYSNSHPLPAPPDRAAESCVPTPPGLVAEWTPEDDLRAGSLYLAPLEVGEVNRVAGKVGIGIAFLGGGHWEFRDADRLNLTRPFTLEGWVYYRGSENLTQDRGVVVAKWSDPRGRLASYGLFVRRNGVPFLAVSPDGLREVRAEATLPLVVEMTHVAGVWDGAMLRLYANGSQVASTPFAGPLLGGAGPLYIAGRRNLETGLQEAIFATLDEIGIYNRALTEAEIRAIYRAGSQGKCR